MKAHLINSKQLLRLKIESLSEAEVPGTARFERARLALDVPEAA
jgi:hypothetical protein